MSTQIEQFTKAPNPLDDQEVFDVDMATYVTETLRLVTQANALGQEMQINADVAAALILAMALPQFAGTSTSSVTVGTGARTFATQAGKGWLPGQIVVVSSGANYVKGTVTDYTGTDLDLNVTSINGSGAFASWTIGLSYEGLSLAGAGNNNNITSMGNNTSTVYATGGTSTAYSITPTPAITAYAIGQSFVVNFSAASGAAPTLQISGIATPPNLVAENGDGTYRNIGLNELPINHRSRVTLISATQALVERTAQGVTYGAPVAAASQAAIGFTGIPANAKKVAIILTDFGTNGSSVPVVRGGSGSYEASGYAYSNGQFAEGGSPVVSLSPTSGFGFNGNSWSSGVRINGRIEFVSVGSYQWIVTGSFGRTDSAILGLVAGRKTFSGSLDRLQLTTVNGTDLITSGLAQVNYEV